VGLNQSTLEKPSILGEPFQGGDHGIGTTAGIIPDLPAQFLAGGIEHDQGGITVDIKLLAQAGVLSADVIGQDLLVREIDRDQNIVLPGERLAPVISPRAPFQPAKMREV